CEQRHPQVALARSVAPVSVDRSAGAVSLAHQEEAAALAAADRLRGVVEREGALEALAIGLHEVDPVLVGPAAVAALPVALDPLHGARRVRIPTLPHPLPVPPPPPPHLPPPRQPT